MAESETVKLEIELPKDQIHISPVQVAETEEEKPPPSDDALEKLRQAVAQKKAESGGKTDDEPNGAAATALEAVKSPADAIPAVRDKSPPNKKQMVVIAIGLSIALIGLLLWPVVNFVLGISVAIIGAVVVAFATLVKI